MFHNSYFAQKILFEIEHYILISSRLTLVCLNCDLLVDASGGDMMTKHLTDRPTHICKVIQEKGLWFFIPSSITWVMASISVTSYLKRLFLVFNPADIKAKDRVWVETATDITSCHPFIFSL